MYHFDWIKRHAERTPDKLALVDAHSGRQLSYAQFNARANRLASFFSVTLGLQVGDRVSILAQNSTEYFEVLFACGKTGVILNTLNWRLAMPELAYILNDSAPRVVIKSGQSLRAEEVIAFCQGKLARYKIPQSVVFVESLPRTAAGKVLKRELYGLVGAESSGEL